MTEPKALTSDDVADRMGRGSALLFVGRLASMAFLFAKTIVIPFFVIPDEFGLFQVAFSIATIVQGVCDAGFEVAIVAKQRVEDFLDLLFSFNILRSVLIAALLLGAAMIAPAFTDDPRLRPMLLVLAVASAAGVLVNPALTSTVKAMSFTPLVKIELMTASSEFALSVLGVWWTGDAWGLVWGKVISVFCRVAASYILVPHHPKWDLRWEPLRDLFRFGLWLFLGTVIHVVATYGDRVLVASVLDVHSAGIWSHSSSLTQAAVLSLVMSMASAAYPGFTHLTDARERATAFLRVMHSAQHILLWVCFNVWLLVTPAYNQFFDAKWVEGAWVSRLLAVAVMTRAMDMIGGSYMLAVGKPVFNTLFVAVRFVLLFGGMALGGHFFGLNGMALGFTLASGIHWMITMWWLHSHGQVPLTPLIAKAARLLPPAALIAAVGLSSNQIPRSPVLFVLLYVLANAIYGGTIYLCDRPAAILAWSRATQILQRLGLSKPGPAVS